MNLDRTGTGRTRWMILGNPPNALDIAFDGRLTAGRKFAPYVGARPHGCLWRR